MANAEKVAAVAELTERFKDSTGAVLTEYRGLSVAQLAELRRSLGDHATFAVVKNTLTKIAVNEAGLGDELSSLLSGPSAKAVLPRPVLPRPLPPRPAPPRPVHPRPVPRPPRPRTLRRATKADQT